MIEAPIEIVTRGIAMGAFAFFALLTAGYICRPVTWLLKNIFHRKGLS